MDYETLTKRYPRFDYLGFTVEHTPQALRITYSFQIEGLSAFHPSWTFPRLEGFSGTDSAAIHSLAFHLGMVELVSYWKITCSPSVYIHAGSLTEEQIHWWKKLYYNGLGEFFYRNGIPADRERFMSVHTLGPELPPATPLPAGSLNGNLIPVGGGKDSAVTLDLLQPFARHNLCYMVNAIDARLQTAATAGYDERQIVIAGRTLDANMLRLNKEGFLNGHTPLSAVVAFSGLLAAYLYGKRYVVLSNESSANDSTVAGAEINHQYSKSFEFEADFSQYVQTHLNYGMRYFSLLRPFCELQIAEYFARLPAYHTVFNSCNLGSKTNSWCLHCSKCLFVYIILSPFLPADRLRAIFGADLLEDPKLLDDFEKLTGKQPDKPFECVGSREEVHMAVSMAIQRMRREGEAIPYLYRSYLEDGWSLLPEQDITYRRYWDSEHLIPPDYLPLVEKSGMYVSRQNL